MAFSEILRSVALVRTDVSEELRASIIRVTRIGELGMLAVPTIRQFLQEPHGVTSQKTPFFIKIVARKMVWLRQIMVWGGMEWYHMVWYGVNSEH
jgi:hypothetical protein